MNALYLKRIFTGLVVIIGCLVCALLGFFVGGSIGLDATSVKIDEIDWITLGKPPVAIDNLLYVDPYSVFVSAIDGKVFTRNIECTAEPCWAVTDTPSWDSTSWSGENLVIAETCEIDTKIKTPPGSIAECAMNTLAMPGGYETEYLVLLEDGTVWVWMKGAYDIDYGIGLFGLFIYGALGIVISVVGYSIFILVFYLLRRKLSASRGKPLA